MPSPSKPSSEQESIRQAARQQRFRRELLGMFGGIGAALMLSAAFPAIRENVSVAIFVLWGGAIGGLLASYERFELAGAALTRRDNRTVNLLVGFGLPLAILGIVYYLLT